MSENIIEAFDALGKEIGALKHEIERKTWEIESLERKNKELRKVTESLEQELKAACVQLEKYTKLKPCEERGGGNG